MCDFEDCIFMKQLMSDVTYRETRPLRKQASLSTAEMSSLRSGARFPTILQRRELLCPTI